MMANIVMAAQPLEISDYVCRTNYGEFQRCVVENTVSKEQEWYTTQGGLLSLRVSSTTKTTNWVIETTNLPISLTHEIYYANLNKDGFLQMISVEPLEFPKDWKYIGSNFPVASVTFERSRNILIQRNFLIEFLGTGSVWQTYVTNQCIQHTNQINYIVTISNAISKETTPNIDTFLNRLFNLFKRK
jgi:hypothetical protein